MFKRRFEKNIKIGFFANLGGPGHHGDVLQNILTIIFCSALLSCSKKIIMIIASLNSASHRDGNALKLFQEFIVLSHKLF